MSLHFSAAMRRAALSTRAKVTTATNAIQEALGKALPHVSFSPPWSKQHPAPQSSTCDGESDQPTAETLRLSASRGADEGPKEGVGVQHSGSHRLRRPLRDVLNAIREHRSMPDFVGQFSGTSLPGVSPPARLSIPPGARFLARSTACTAGKREYKLYIPSSAASPRGLLVMLHGCKQDPDDFAAGTNMNTIAEANGLIIAYPKQSMPANASSCWNWFNPGDQMRGAGEPAILAAMTRELMSEFSLQRYQVFVAGLSAGGAMAAVMGETYPDLYEAVGIHSGLSYRCANDVISAFAAMRGEFAPQPGVTTRAVPKTRTVIFHGSADSTVVPSNADRIVASVSPTVFSSRQVFRGRAAGGRGYTRTMIVGASDKEPMVEFWLIDGGPHAWSGGQRCGSYTDPQGPDASAEMVRFFLNQPSR